MIAQPLNLNYYETTIWNNAFGSLDFFIITTPKCFSQDDSDVSDGQIHVGRGFAVGDYNIRINYSGGSNLELEIIVAIDDRNNPGSTIGSTANFTKNKFHETIALDKNTAQIWFGDKGEMKWGIRGKAGNKFNPEPGSKKNDLVYVPLTPTFDAKIILETQPTGDPAFIGIEDARDYQGNVTVDELRIARVVSLDYKWANRKRLRMWYETKDGNPYIVLDANSEAKVNKLIVNMCKYSDPGTSDKPNKMSAKWGHFEYSVDKYDQCRP